MYGKLFESTFTGSLYGKGAVTFATWGYAIAHTKPDGLVELNPNMIASALGCQARDVRKAIDFLCAADPVSRTKTDNGKRLIREGEYLYRVVNHSLYNSVRNEPQRREYNRIKKQESRARLAGGQSVSTVDAADGQAGQPLYAVSVSEKREREAEPVDNSPDQTLSLIAIPECPKDMDIEAENEACRAYYRIRSQGVTESRWRSWVLRGASSGIYAKRASRPATPEEIRATRRAIIEKQQQEALNG